MCLLLPFLYAVRLLLLCCFACVLLSPFSKIRNSGFEIQHDVLLMNESYAGLKLCCLSVNPARHVKEEGGNDDASDVFASSFEFPKHLTRLRI